MLKLLLKKLNFEADTAVNGRVAVEMILRNPEQYYLVFMDNLMPELVDSDLSFLRMLCMNQNVSNVPSLLERSRGCESSPQPRIQVPDCRSNGKCIGGIYMLPLAVGVLAHFLGSIL